MKRLAAPSFVGEQLSRQQQTVLRETEAYKVYAAEYCRLLARSDALLRQGKSVENPVLELEIQNAMVLQSALQDTVCAIASGAAADDT